MKGGFYDLVEGLVTSIFSIASLVPRLSPENGSPHYQVLALQASPPALPRDLEATMKCQCHPSTAILLPQVDLEAMAELAGLRGELMGRVQAMMALCGDYRSTLSQYSYLYTEDRKEALGQFLLYGRMLTAEEVEAHTEDGIPENPPLLHQFRAQIDSYEKLHEDVCRLEPVRVFDSWMKIDTRPFKASLLNIIKKWSLMFKQHLVDHVTHR